MTEEEILDVVLEKLADGQEVESEEDTISVKLRTLRHTIRHAMRAARAELARGN